MNLQRLREETRLEHEATEAGMPLFAPGLTTAQYLAVLEAMLPLVVSWEAWAAVRAPGDVQPLLAQRRRAHLLREDVAVLRLHMAKAERQTKPHAPAETAWEVDWDAVIAGTLAAAPEAAGAATGFASTDEPGQAGQAGQAGLWSGMRDEERGVEKEPHAALRAAFLGAWYVMEGSTLGGRFIARHAEAALGLEPGVGDAYFRGHNEATGGLWRETTAVVAAVPEGLSDVVIAAAKRTFVAFGTAIARRAGDEKTAV